MSQSDAKSVTRLRAAWLVRAKEACSQSKAAHLSKPSQGDSHLPVSDLGKTLQLRKRATQVDLFDETVDGTWLKVVAQEVTGWDAASGSEERQSGGRDVGAGATGAAWEPPGGQGRMSQSDLRAPSFSLAGAV